MGQSTPTTTMALDTFQQRYAAFRSELHPREQRWFDELVCRARRHSHAINRRPHMDFERPVMLAMMMEGMRELEETRIKLDQAMRQLEDACAALSEAGLLRSRMPRPVEMARCGQRQLEVSVAT